MKNKHKNLIELGVLFLLLFSFWLVLSPSITIESIIIGIISVSFVVVYSKDLVMTKEDSPLYSFKKSLLLISYIPVLVVEIIKSGIDVAKIVLSKNMLISPGFTKIKVPLKKEFTKVLFANSISLTPGTLTVDIIDDEYIIHHLTEDASRGLINSTLEIYALKLEE